MWFTHAAMRLQPLSAWSISASLLLRCSCTETSDELCFSHDSVLKMGPVSSEEEQCCSVQIFRALPRHRSETETQASSAASAVLHFPMLSRTAMWCKCRTSTIVGEFGRVVKRRVDMMRGC